MPDDLDAWRAAWNTFSNGSFDISSRNGLGRCLPQRIDHDRLSALAICTTPR